MKFALSQWIKPSLLFFLLIWLPTTYAEDKPIKAVATFSIIGDMVQTIGGDRVQVKTIVDADTDAHVYRPTPADAKTMLEADILFVNGFGFEGWLERLIEASGYQGKIVTVTNGIKGLPFEHEDDEKHDDDKHESKSEHHDEHGHAHGDTDPHAWLSLAHAKTYIRNIADALHSADSSGSETYFANRDNYLKKLAELETLVTETLDKLPKERRTLVTSHDAFGYFADAYQLTFLAPQAGNTEIEATARDVAALIEQIRAEKITAAFLENTVSPRLLEQIAAESQVKIGGTLYADALSKADGEAGTYLAMMKHNILTLHNALRAE